jgi:hypothetical protein
MIDHARRQLQIVEKEYLHLIEDNVSQDAFYTGVKRRKWPAKARFFWALQAVYGPERPDTINNDNQGAAE